MPRSLTPVGLGAKPCGASVLPSVLPTTSATTMVLVSGLHHAACALAVYASQPGSPRHHARLASGWGLALAGRDLHPMVLNERFQSNIVILLSQAWPGAQAVELWAACRRSVERLRKRGLC